MHLCFIIEILFIPIKGNIAGDVAHLEDVRFQIQNAMKSSDPNDRLTEFNKEESNLSFDSQFDARLSRGETKNKALEDFGFSIGRHDW